MKLLFIQGGSRWKFDTDGNVYTDSNFNEHIWNRYREYCDDLTVILRKEQNVYSPQEAKKRFNQFDINQSSAVALPDLYRPVTNSLKVSIRAYIEKMIAKEVKTTDKIIIRSLGNIYTNTALKYAKKYHKPYLVEVTGFVRESLWFHSLHGKILAWPKEWQYCHLMKDVPYAVYVTDEALQNRYPCKGVSIGCSDVEIQDMDKTVLEKRLDKIQKGGTKLIIGTAALLDVRWKGQVTVIKALARLKKEGITNIEYHLIGVGSGNYLKELSKSLGVENQVCVIGALPHEAVSKWMDSIDIYVQPSFQEGLCRSIVEAMSRACPVIASDVGGNYELVNKKWLFKKGNVSEITALLKSMISNGAMKQAAIDNFETAKKYSKDILDKKRDEFYTEFLNN